MTLQSVLLGLAIALYGLASFWSVRGLLGTAGVRHRPVVYSLVAGSVPLLAVLLWRGLSAERLPVFGRFEALTVYSLSVVTAFLLAASRDRMRGLAALLIPYVTILLLLGAAAVHHEVVVDVPMDPFWLGLHVAGAFAGYGLCTLAGVLGLAYLIQDRNLKTKRLGRLFERLPALETLDHVMATQIGAAFIMLTLSVACGARLVYLSGGGAEWLRDPKVVSTLITWGVYAVLMHMRTNADRHGKGMAVIVLVGLCFVLFSFLGVHVLADSLHGFVFVEGGAAP